jgi:DNA polymerase-3 subunit epsilon
MYPGKRNSLDALCDRLGVDNSGRTLHGALLDAELLADVYINLTRGQEALLIDAGPDEGKAGSEEAVDLSAFVLPVIQANTQEHAAHEDQLAQLDKASDGKTIWRLVVPV